MNSNVFVIGIDENTDEHGETFMHLLSPQKYEKKPKFEKKITSSRHRDMKIYIDIVW